MLKHEFSGLRERQDTASKQHTEALKLLQQISKDLHELTLEQSQVIQRASEDHKREQVQLIRIENSLDQALATVPSKPCLELSSSIVTALQEMEVIVAVW